MKSKWVGILLMAVVMVCAGAWGKIPKGYKGKAYKDGTHRSGAQKIPGRVEAALFDLGGEGVAYHDVDAINHGSGELNYKEGHCEEGVAASVCRFREKDGVDISYVKKGADLNHGNVVAPEWQQLYVGWTEDGEWSKYTVKVKKAGRYKIVAMYTNVAQTVEFTVNGEAAGECTLPGEPWRQIEMQGLPEWVIWHVWNKAECGEIRFAESGKQVLGVTYKKGNNFAYWDFVEVEEQAERKRD